MSLRDIATEAIEVQVKDSAAFHRYASQLKRETRGSLYEDYIDESDIANGFVEDEVNWFCRGYAKENLHSDMKPDDERSPAAIAAFDAEPRERRERLSSVGAELARAAIEYIPAEFWLLSLNLSSNEARAISRYVEDLVASQQDLDPDERSKLARWLPQEKWSMSEIESRLCANVNPGIPQTPKEFEAFMHSLSARPAPARVEKQAIAQIENTQYFQSMLAISGDPTRASVSKTQLQNERVKLTSVLQNAYAEVAKLQRRFGSEAALFAGGQLATSRLPHIELDASDKPSVFTRDDSIIITTPAISGILKTLTAAQAIGLLEILYSVDPLTEDPGLTHEDPGRGEGTSGLTPYLSAALDDPKPFEIDKKEVEQISRGILLDRKTDQNLDLEVMTGIADHFRAMDDLYKSSLEFMFAHELGHVVLAHRDRHLPCQRRELEADSYAETLLLMTSAPLIALGPNLRDFQDFTATSLATSGFIFFDFQFKNIFKTNSTPNCEYPTPEARLDNLWAVRTQLVDRIKHEEPSSDQLDHVCPKLLQPVLDLYGSADWGPKDVSEAAILVAKLKDAIMRRTMLDEKKAERVMELFIANQEVDRFLDTD